MNKIQSEIIRIDLLDASYKETGTYIEPTYVNFFFGNNGTGKSTVAKAIKNGTGITYAPGRTSADYLPLVYNQEFINENFKSYRDMKGVFTLNAKNNEIQTKIDEQTAIQDNIKKALSTAIEERDKKVIAKEKMQKDFFKGCWDKEKSFREEFSKTQVKRAKSEPFMREVLNHVPKDIDIEELRLLYDSAFSETAKRYTRFYEIPDTSVLDTIDGSDILSVAIVNSAETELAKILRKIGSTEWMHQAHEEYSVKADGVCPYCGRKLPHDFEETVINSFDTTYQDNLALLDSFLTTYRQAANTLFISLQKLPVEIYPQIDSKSYTDKLAVLKAEIQSNIDIIKSKKENPALVVKVSSVENILKELANIILGFNRLIDTNNLIVDAGPKKRDECIDLAFSILAFRLKDQIEAYKKSDYTLAEEITNLNKKIKEYEYMLAEIKSKIKILRTQTVETDTAKDSINQMLRDSGMQGFSLQPKLGVEHVYEVRRPNGDIADNLSEGEKNFIAFLYFYHLVHGSISEDGDIREKIVVIDDPVSSMDSSSLFIVSTLVRKMIEICRNNADNRNRTVDGNFIKQIFILTHNAYFHKEITYGYVSKYEYASFYLIKKHNSKSSIRLYDRINPDIPTERMNINPVKNSYAALWDEYKEIDSAVPLMNVIKRILEYYFLQLCGYEGSTLRDRILVKGKAEGKFKNEDGTDNEERYQMASAMLSYINASSLGMNDGMDFVEDYLDADECKNVFEMIFESMEQKQHFDMMIGNK